MAFTKKDLENFENFKELNPVLFKPGLMQQELSKAQGSNPGGEHSKKMVDISKIWGASRRSTPPTPEQQARLEYHIKEVKSKPMGLKYVRRAPEKKPLMKLAKAKKEVWAIMKRLLEKQKRQFIFDQYNKNLLAGLTKYFTWQASSPYCLEKGLWLFGPTGVGKSFLFEVFEAFTNKFKLPTSFKLHNLKTIAANCQQEGVGSLKKYFQGFNAFDDVGFENTVKYMGNSICVFGELINELYKKHTKTGKIALVTTNLLPPAIGAKYGERIEDRLKQLFTFVCLGGGSKR